MEERDILEQRQVVCNGFVTYTQEIVDLAKQGYVLDVRNKTSPQFQLGLFTANMLLMQDVSTETVEEVVEAKPKRVYNKSEQKKEALRAKLPAEAVQTITK